MLYFARLSAYVLSLSMAGFVTSVVANLAMAVADFVICVGFEVAMAATFWHWPTVASCLIEYFVLLETTRFHRMMESKFDGFPGTKTRSRAPKACTAGEPKSSVITLKTPVPNRRVTFEEPTEQQRVCYEKAIRNKKSKIYSGKVTLYDELLERRKPYNAFDLLSEELETGKPPQQEQVSGVTAHQNNISFENNEENKENIAEDELSEVFTDALGVIERDSSLRNRLPLSLIIGASFSAPVWPAETPSPVTA